MMSFRGPLHEVGLPEVLQLIASQHKTGWLKVISGGKCRFLFFRKGRITSTANPADRTDRFAEYLVHGRRLPVSLQERLLAETSRTGHDTATVLSRGGFLPRADVRTLFEGMIEEDVFELMAVQRGQYEFESDDSPDSPSAHLLAVEVGPMLMEAARKSDEIQEMRSALGSDQSIPVLIHAEAVDPQDEAAGMVLRLVDGRRSVGELVNECGMDRHSTMRILHAGVREGILSLLPSTPGSAPTPPGSGRASSTAATRLGLSAAFLLAVIFTVAQAPGRHEDPVLREYLTLRDTMKRASARHDRFVESGIPPALLAECEARSMPAASDSSSIVPPPTSASILPAVPSPPAGSAGVH
ncbi:MAG: DUF4388 domain-containing protein [Gemmatimonadota bacterium]|jgi:hypothetical protein|nr:DUF4388 domain-containing protein [Gemmatimonadota bacterium]